MALRNYVVLKGRPSALALDDDESPHIEVRLEAAGTSYRLAVNARSAVAPHDLLYRKQDPFAHPMTSALEALAEGLTDLRGARPELALDYVRGAFVERAAMSIAPFELTGPANDLREFLEPVIQGGIDDGQLVLYAFGERWGPEPNDPDQYFGFLPGNGVHDIHMNQGSAGRFADTNAPNQDGALLIHDPARGEWSAVFLAFQSQSWITDPTTGHPTEDPVEHPEVDPLRPSLTIVAALVNAPGQEEGRETVTLLNRSDAPIDLAGWSLADRVDRRHALTGSIGAGEALRVTFGEAPDEPKLGNKGGEIRLLAPDGAVAHAIEYARHDAGTEGWTTVF